MNNKELALKDFDEHGDVGIDKIFTASDISGFI